MCRWLAYTGSSIYLDELIFRPEHSLIDQSLHADRGATTTNGDGFGIGWYGTRPEPGLFRDIQPAWNDGNLRNLTTQIESTLFLAHVRATTGTAVQRTNCHPFAHGRWLFMHNGAIRRFEEVRRQLVCEVAPELYTEIKGSTDSELMFFLALTYGLAEEPISALERMAGFVERVGRENGVESPLQMTLAVTDGERLVAVRHSSEHRSRSLYCSKCLAGFRHIVPDLERFSDDSYAIVSEPLDDVEGSIGFWEEVPESTVVVVENATVERRPFQPS